MKWWRFLILRKWNRSMRAWRGGLLGTRRPDSGDDRTTTGASVRQVCGRNPHVSQNQRDMGHPEFTCRLADARPAQVYPNFKSDGQECPSYTSTARLGSSPCCDC